MRKRGDKNPYLERYNKSLKEEDPEILFLKLELLKNLQIRDTTAATNVLHMLMKKEPKNKTYQAQFNLVKKFKEQDDNMELQKVVSSSESSEWVNSSDEEDKEEEEEEESEEEKEDFPKPKRKKVLYKKVKVIKGQNNVKAPKPRNASQNVKLLKKQGKKKTT